MNDIFSKKPSMISFNDKKNNISKTQTTQKKKKEVKTSNRKDEKTIDKKISKQANAFSLRSKEENKNNFNNVNNPKTRKDITTIDKKENFSPNHKVDKKTVTTKEDYYKGLANKQLKISQNETKLKQNELNKERKKAYEEEGIKTAPEFKDLRKERLSFEDKDKKITALQDSNELREKYKNLYKKTKQANEEVSEAENDERYSQYLKDVVDAQSKPVTNLEKSVVGNAARATKDLFSNVLTGGEDRYKSSDGNEYYLPSYNELRQEEVSQNYKTGLGRILGDGVYGATKVAEASLLDAATFGVGGKALYWSDMAQDKYKTAYNKTQEPIRAFANATIATLSELTAERAMGGFARQLTGGAESQFSNILANTFYKAFKNPKIASVFGSMGAEGSEEFLQEYIDRWNDLATIEGETNPMKYLSVITDVDVLKSALYAFGVGAVSAGGLNGVSTSLGRNPEVKKIENDAMFYGTLKQTLEQKIQNTQSEVLKQKYQDTINDIDNYMKKPFGNEKIGETTESNLKKVEMTESELNLIEGAVSEGKITEDEAVEIIKQYDAIKQENPDAKITLEKMEEQEGGVENGNNNSANTTMDNNDASQRVNDENISDQKSELGDQKSENTEKQIENNNDSGNNKYETIKEDKIVAKEKPRYVFKMDGKELATQESIKTKETIDRAVNNIKGQIENETNGNKTSKFKDNATKKSKFLKEETRLELMKEDFFNYIPETQEEVMNRVLKHIDEVGVDKATVDFLTKENLTEDDVGTGWALLKVYDDIGDYDSVASVARQMTTGGRGAGRTVKMYDLMARLTPEGMIRYATKELMNAQETFNKGKSLKEREKYQDNFTLSPEETKFISETMKKVQKIEQGKANLEDLLLDENSNKYAKKLNKAIEKDYNKFVKENNQEGIKELVDRVKEIKLAQIQNMLGEKLPREKGMYGITDKQSVHSLMRISMLFNVKTQGRNILGNTAAAGMNALSDIPAAIVDKAISKVTGIRTISANAQVGTYAKGFAKGGKYAWQDFRLGIDTKDASLNRYDTPTSNTQAFDTNHKILKPLNLTSKAGNYIDKTLNLAVSGGDRIFYQAAFDKSLKNQMVLNEKTSPTAEMVEIARQEALQRTWNDNNQYTNFVLRTRSSLNKLFGLENKIGYGVGDILIPFAKTPANLTKAMVDYSPLGLVSSIMKGGSIYNDAKAGTLTSIEQHNFAQNLGKGMAGTLLYMIAAGAAQSGLISGGDDEDKDLKDFKKNTLGISPYSVTINGKSYTYDWLQPFATPFAISADLKNKKDSANPDEQKKGLEKMIDDIMSSGNIAAQQLLNQSFMKSIAEALENNDGVMSGLFQQILNLPSRAIPTLMSQISQMTDDTKRQTYVKGDYVQTAKNNIDVKLPWKKSELPAQVNTLGKELKHYGGKDEGLIKYAIRAFISPANYNEAQYSKAADELYDVYINTGDKNMLPRKSETSVKIDGKTVRLTNKQVEAIQKESGDILSKSVEALTLKGEYNRLSAEEKAEVIKGLLGYANAKAVADNVDGKEISSTYRKAESENKYGYTIADVYLDKVLKGKTTKSDVDYEGAYSKMASYGIDARTYEKFRDGIGKVKGTKNAKGNTIRGSAQANRINWMNENFPELTREQKQALLDDYANKSGITSFYSYKERNY